MSHSAVFQDGISGDDISHNQIIMLIFLIFWNKGLIILLHRLIDNANGANKNSALILRCGSHIKVQ
jgi:hypothetical protein